MVGGRGGRDPDGGGGEPGGKEGGRGEGEPSWLGGEPRWLVEGEDPGGTHVHGSSLVPLLFV